MVFNPTKSSCSEQIMHSFATHSSPKGYIIPISLYYYLIEMFKMSKLITENFFPYECSIDSYFR